MKLELAFTGKTVRVVGTDEVPLFVASDVCSILGLGNVSQALNGNADSGADGLEEDEKGVTNLEVRSNSGVVQQRQVLCVTESGLYSLIFKSRKPQAKAFRKWVTSEVLPEIRRTGRYDIAEQAKRLAFDRFLVEIPCDWRRTFGDDWFSAVLGIYGLDYVKARTPGFVGKFISEYVYSAMIEGLPEELKSRREVARADGAKLHQFLAAEAKDKLRDHLAAVKVLAINSQGRPDDFRESFDRVFRGRNQLLLAMTPVKKARAA